MISQSYNSQMTIIQYACRKKLNVTHIHCKRLWLLIT